MSLCLRWRPSVCPPPCRLRQVSGLARSAWQRVSSSRAPAWALPPSRRRLRRCMRNSRQGAVCRRVPRAIRASATMLWSACIPFVSVPTAFPSRAERLLAQCCAGCPGKYACMYPCSAVSRLPGGRGT